MCIRDRRYNVSVEKVAVRVPMKETPIATAQAQGRHVKQSGGHGQFAVVHLTMEPLSRGTGNEFHETVVEGVEAAPLAAESTGIVARVRRRAHKLGLGGGDT